MIRLRTLGALDLRGSGGEELLAVLAQPRRAALLVYLALAMPRGTQRRDTILTLFWPELDTDHARNALGQAVHFLRRTISADAIVTRNGDGLAIDWSTFWCDAAAFEEALDANRLGEAIALYRGDLLAGFHIADAPEFERWLDSERERLVARYAKAVQTLAAEREAANDFAGAAQHWRALVASDPYNSRLTLHLMRALKAAGDPAGALLQARQHERLLREELGIAPDAEVSALVRQLQAERPEHSSAAPAATSVQPSDHSAAAAAQSSSRPPSPEVRRVQRRKAILTIALVAASVAGAAAALWRRSDDVTIAPTSVATQAGAQLTIPDSVYVREMHVRARNAETSRSEIGMATARDAWERAIARDSTFAPAHAGLAILYGALGQNGFMLLRQAMDSQRIIARRAVTIDSTDSEARTALAISLANAHELKAAEREFERAISLNPADARARFWYSTLLIAFGRGEEAQRELQRASELGLANWRMPQAMQRYAHWLITNERPERKLPPKDRRPSLKGEPGDPWAIARQASDLAEVGECTDARSDLESALRLAPNNVKMRPFMGRVEWWCGDRARARALLDDMKRRPDRRDNAFDAALMHIFFGEKDSAFVWLEYNHWDLPELTQLSASPYLDPLRRDPRLPQLQRRLGVR